MSDFIYIPEELSEIDDDAMDDFERVFLDAISEPIDDSPRSFTGCFTFAEKPHFMSAADVVNTLGRDRCASCKGWDCSTCPDRPVKTIDPTVDVEMLSFLKRDAPEAQ